MSHTPAAAKLTISYCGPPWPTLGKAVTVALDRWNELGSLAIQDHAIGYLIIDLQETNQETLPDIVANVSAAGVVEYYDQPQVYDAAARRLAAHQLSRQPDTLPLTDQFSPTRGTQ
jgi:hypothetical protein